MSAERSVEQSVELHHVIQTGQVWHGQSTLQSPQTHSCGISSGYETLDAQLPQAGWQPGQVCEIYHQGLGTGELSLVLPALAQLSQSQQWILWVAPPAMPYAPALEALGVDIRRVLVVHPKNHQEALWCLEEGLKSGHCSAVLGWLYEWQKTPIRRLQLAAQSSAAYCWLWPQTTMDQSGSPAALRLSIERNNPWTVRARFHKRRGSWPSDTFEVPLMPSNILQRRGSRTPPNSLQQPSEQLQKQVG